MTALISAVSDFKTVFGDLRTHDAFYRFLQNIYRLYPEDRFHTLIKEISAALPDDERIYREVQRRLPSITPALAALRYALPALFKQKREIARQTLALLDATQRIDGYIEIGSTGRYISELRKHLRFEGRLVLVNDVAPSNSPVDIMERGGLRKLGDYVPLGDYDPLPAALGAASFDLVTCYIGLHHAPLERLDGFVQSIVRVLRPGGCFILRDHDVNTPQMRAFVSLAHTVFNAGLGVPWPLNAAELRLFRPIEDWIDYLAQQGLQQYGPKLVQAHDPSDNVLLAFRKALA
jgi:SAM-dependent methyltransferase